MARPFLFALLLFGHAAAQASEPTHWRGLVIAPEDRCSHYNRKDYAYSQSVEPKIAEQLGKIISPYTGECFSNLRQTQIEHIVAIYEAHKSGLCSADMATRRAFGSDLLNLTLAAPSVNRKKGAKDATEWMPQRNSCWFAHRVLQVRLKYQLTIDRREADALEAVLAACPSVEMDETECVAQAADTENAPQQ